MSKRLKEQAGSFARRKESKENTASCKGAALLELGQDLVALSAEPRHRRAARLYALQRRLRRQRLQGLSGKADYDMKHNLSIKWLRDWLRNLETSARPRPGQPPFPQAFSRPVSRAAAKGIRRRRPTRAVMTSNA